MADDKGGAEGGGDGRSGPQVVANEATVGTQINVNGSARFSWDGLAGAVSTAAAGGFLAFVLQLFSSFALALLVGLVICLMAGAVYFALSSREAR